MIPHTFCGRGLEHVARAHYCVVLVGDEGMDANGIWVSPSRWFINKMIVWWKGG